MRTSPVNLALLAVVRRAVTLAGLAPLLALLAWAATAVPANIAFGYPYAMLVATAVLLYLGYGRYTDPARYPSGAASGRFPRVPRVPTVSVLMPVHAAGRTASAVRALVATEHPAVEIIVVDDGTTGETAALLDRLAAELPIALLRLDRPIGQRRALLHAAAHASGDLLAFVGDGCLLAPDAIGRCVAAFQGHPDLGAVGGHTRAGNAGHNALTGAHDACSAGRFRVGLAARAAAGAVADLPGGLAVFRRDAVYNYLPAWGPARPLAALVAGQPWTGQKLKARYAQSPFVRQQDHPALPWRVGYVRSARVYATAPTRPVALLAQALRRAVAPLRAARFTGGFVWRTGAGPAALHYGGLLGALAGPPAAAWHLLWEPAHGRWLPAVTYLAAAALSGTAYGLAAALDRPGPPGWALRPLASLAAAVLAPALPAYAAIMGCRRRTAGYGRR